MEVNCLVHQCIYWTQCDAVAHGSKNSLLRCLVTRKGKECLYCLGIKKVYKKFV